MMGPALIVRNAEFAGAAFSNVDGPAVFDRCLPRWEIAGVNLYETASYIVRG